MCVYRDFAKLCTLIAALGGSVHISFERKFISEFTSGVDIPVFVNIWC